LPVLLAKESQAVRHAEFNVKGMARRVNSAFTLQENQLIDNLV